MIWFGKSAADDLSRYLYDVLALVMCEMQKSDAKNEATSFDDFRKLLYRHLDALANQANLRPEQERIPFGWMRRRFDRLQIGLVGCCVPGVDSPAQRLWTSP